MTLFRAIHCVVNRLNQDDKRTPNVAHSHHKTLTEVVVQPTELKALMAGFGTGLIAVLGRWADTANAMAIEYMPLITAFGILVGAAMTGFYYIFLAWAKHQDFKHRERERRLKHLQREHEAYLAELARQDDVPQ